MPTAIPTSEDWQHKAARKRAAQLELIPSGWRLELSPEALPGALPLDVRDVPRTSGMMSEDELTMTDETDAAVILARLQRGEWTAVSVATAFSKRAAIAQQLTNCLTEPLFERALARAATLDAHLAETGEVVGPLHGLPVSLKEQFDIERVESTMGFVSRIGHVSETSAALVQMLESLGAVIFARTNIPQTLLSDESVNHIFGRVLNPLNTTLTAGGSSGGEAALVAMRGSPLGIGTDLGGSIRKPASFRRLYSLRPTSRRLPYAGASNIFEGAEALESVLGPMANSLESLRVLMRAIIGGRPWEYDAKVVERGWDDKLARADGDEEKKCFAFMWSDGLVRPQPPIERGMRELADKLRAAGHEVIDWEPLDHAGAQDIVSRIFDADGGEDVRRWLGDSGEPTLPQVFKSQHPAMSAWETWQLNKHRDAYRQLFLSTYTATRSRSNSQTDRPIDAIVCPVAPHLAAPHLEFPRPAGLITYTTIWSLLDLPCYTFPVGRVDAVLDPKPENGVYVPKSEVDRANWEGCASKSSSPRPFAFLPEDALQTSYENPDRALGRA